MSSAKMAKLCSCGFSQEDLNGALSWLEHLRACLWRLDGNTRRGVLQEAFALTFRAGSEALPLCHINSRPIEDHPSISAAAMKFVNHCAALIDADWDGDDDHLLGADDEEVAARLGLAVAASSRKDVSALGVATSGGGPPITRADLPPEWAQEQLRLAALVDLDDRRAGFRMPWEDGNPDKAAWPPLRYVGGVDISFVKDTNVAVASLVVLDYHSKTVEYESMFHCTMNLPYVAGYLAFREVGPLVTLFEKCKREAPEKVPQIIFVDGNGLLHPRKCGLACHLGVLIDTPTIGVAKNMLAVDGVTREVVDNDMFGRRGAVTQLLKKGNLPNGDSPAKNYLHPLIGRSGMLWGHAALTGNSSKNPVYISAGHKISTESASRLALTLAVQRVIEPIRQADLRSRQYVRQHFDADGNLL